jgi:hypothetical protein
MTVLHQGPQSLRRDAVRGDPDLQLHVMRSGVHQFALGIRHAEHTAGVRTAAGAHFERYQFYSFGGRTVLRARARLALCCPRPLSVLLKRRSCLSGRPQAEAHNPRTCRASAIAVRWSGLEAGREQEDPAGLKLLNRRKRCAAGPGKRQMRAAPAACGRVVHCPDLRFRSA